MRLLFGRLVHVNGRQPDDSTGAGAPRSPRNADGQDGHGHAAILAVSSSRLNHVLLNRPFTLRAISGLPTGVIWIDRCLSRAYEMRFQLSLRCWLLGHEDFVRRAPDRLYLQCIECGRETRGWCTATGTTTDEGQM
jgi:hypothetical protein